MNRRPSAPRIDVDRHQRGGTGPTRVDTNGPRVGLGRFGRPVRAAGSGGLRERVTLRTRRARPSEEGEESAALCVEAVEQ